MVDLSNAADEISQRLIKVYPLAMSALDAVFSRRPVRP